MITTVSTVKADPGDLLRWAERNLAAGVDRMVVFVDDIESGEAATDRAWQRLAERVELVHPDEWWGGRRRPGKLNVRQRINANATLTALRGASTDRSVREDWLFHIDGDEVLHLDVERLLSLPTDVEAVQLTPLEAVAQWEWPGGEVTRFKRPLTQAELDLLLLLGKVEQPDNADYFHGHVTGKAGVRLGSTALLGIHTPIDSQRHTVPGLSAEWLQVLHYESHDFSEFVRKWRNLVTSGPAVAARSKRGRLASAMSAGLWEAIDPAAREAAMRDLFERTTLDDLATLDSLGLLVALPELPPAPAGGRDGAHEPIKPAILALVPRQMEFRLDRS